LKETKAVLKQTTGKEVEGRADLNITVIISTSD
jgi:hypothetical protein